MLENGMVSGAVALCRQTEAAIDALPDGRQRLLLRLRYIDGRTWEQIAVRMGYSFRQILRMHGTALENMSLNVTLDL